MNPQVAKWEAERRAFVAAKNKPAPKQKGKKGILTSLISEAGGAGGAAAGASAGAALGSVVPGIGTAIGGIAGAIIGGFGGGTVGRGIENKVRDDQNFFGKGGSAKAAFGEGALSGALSGLGQGLKVVKAGKALTGEKGITNMAKNFRAGANAPTSASRLTQVSKGLKKSGAGALDAEKEGFRAFANADARLATLEKYKIPSGQTGLKKGALVINQLETKLEPVLKSVKVKTSELNKLYDDVLKFSESSSAGATKSRIINAQKQAIKNASKDGFISGDELRKIRSSVGSGVFAGAETPEKVLKKEIYKAYGDLIGNKSSKAKAILGEQHNILDLEKGLSKQAGGLRIPVGGAGIKLKSAGQARDFAIDKAASITGKLGRVTGNPVGVQAIRQAPGGLGRILSAPQSMEQPQDMQTDQMPQDFGMFTGEAPQGMGQMQQFEQPQEPTYTLQNALMDAQRDPKNASQYLAFAKAFQDQQTASQKSNGLNVTKITAQNYGLAKAGSRSLQQLASLIQSDPSVVTKSATPGGNLPIVGGYIRNAAGVGEYDALAFNTIDALLRARTGAAAPESEIRRYVNKLIPRAGDSPSTIQTKLRELQASFDETLALAEGQGTQESDLASILSQGY